LIGVLTVYETIYFASSLRLPLTLPATKKRALVEEVVAEMGLTECMHTPIGNWHVRGVSGGQRRRVSIAMELVTKPSLLFLVKTASLSLSASLLFLSCEQFAVSASNLMPGLTFEPHRACATEQAFDAPRGRPFEIL
jgi:ABC-type Na+ transport system ATPase subunit NatA